MADDFSALELDTELDDDMRALFGYTQEPTVPPAPSSSATSSRMQHQNVLSNVTPSHRFQHQQSLACITNKRPASELKGAWPHKLRQPSMPAAQASTDFDDLELEAPVSSSSCGMSAIASSRIANGSNTGAGDWQCNAALRAQQRPSSQLLNVGSQVTEQWGTATISQAVSQTRSAPQQAFNSQQPHAQPRLPAQAPSASTTTDVSLALVRAFVYSSKHCLQQYKQLALPK